MEEIKTNNGMLYWRDCRYDESFEINEIYELNLNYIEALRGSILDRIH